MKVKNVMFAGFAAAILSGVCGAARAEESTNSADKYILASKAFVTAQANALDVAKQDKFDNADVLSGITADQLEQIATNEADIAQNATDIAKKANTDDVYSKGAADATFATKEFVGTIPTDATATDVVGYVQEKTSGIATNKNLEELTTRVATAEGDIDDLESAMTGGADVEGSVAQKIASAISAEESRADGKYQVKGDYALKSELPEVPTNVSAFNNDSGYLTEETAGALYDVKGAAAGVEAKLADYATDADLQGVKATADAALPADTFNTFKETVNADAIADAKKAGTDAADALNTYKGEMTTTLADYAKTADIPTDYVNNTTFTNYQGTVTSALDGKVDDSAFETYQGTVTAELAEKQNTIENLSTIEAGAAKGATAVQPGANVSVLTNDAEYLSSKGLAAGTYLVSADSTGAVTYKQIQVVNANGVAEDL